MTTTTMGPPVGSTPQAATPDDNLTQMLGRAPRLLLAEDDDELRWALAAALTKKGFVVEQVTTSLELLDRFATAIAAKDAVPDVVVSDVRMPGYNAVNVVSGLRDTGWRIPVVFISAFDDPNQGRARGVERACFLKKPLKVEELV